MRVRGALIVAVLVVAAVLPTTLAGQGHTAHDETVTSFDGTAIEITVFRPADATGQDPVPVLLHSHGWAGQRWDRSEVNDSAEPYLDAGFGVVSIDMRGHGGSGGQAHVHSPDHEARDAMAVIDRVADKGWVATDAPGDPVLGALGGSYGGGYQLVTALEETRRDGETRFDALAPEITWHNLTEALAPNSVARSVWIDLLYWAAKASGTEVAPYVDRAYATTLATGEVPDDVARRFARHSPSWYVDHDVRLDVPALYLQGTPDTLFPFGHGVDNYYRTLTDDARADSSLVGHRGGHVLNSNGTLPGPDGVGIQPPAGPSPCTEPFGNQTTLKVDWYRHHLLGADVDLPGGVGWPVEDDRCWPPQDAGLVGVITSRQEAEPLTPAGAPTVVGPAPATQYLELAEGWGTLASSNPTLEATATSASTDARLFFALAAGDAPHDVRILSSQWTPWRPDHTIDTVDLEMAYVANTLDDDESLYLAVSPWVDQFAHDSSRQPGAVLLQDVRVWVPSVF